MPVFATFKKFAKELRSKRPVPSDHVDEVVDAVDDSVHVAPTSGSGTGDAVDMAAERAEEYERSLDD